MRKKHEALPLELRWRMPIGLPAEGQEVEIGFVRFLADSQRITVGPHRAGRLAPHPLTTAGVPATLEGWTVYLNGAPVAPEADPLSFIDACLAGWGVFVQIVPAAAETLGGALAWRAAREEWPIERMEVQIRYAHENADNQGARAALADAGTVAD
jgi:hypothetical protein